MRKFEWVGGRVDEVHRYIKVSDRWCEQFPARERRELWIAAPDGSDWKFVVHSRLMPAKRGHNVVAVMFGDDLVAFHNLQTGGEVNYLRTDPPLLLSRCEGARSVAFVIGGLTLLLAYPCALSVTVALASMLWMPGLIGVRVVRRWMMARAAEDAMDSAIRRLKGERHLRRVK